MNGDQITNTAAQVGKLLELFLNVEYMMQSGGFVGDNIDRWWNNVCFVRANLPASAHALLTRLERAERVVEAVKAWIDVGNEKVLHVLTCEECKRLEVEQDKWCAQASIIGRRQLDAAAVLRTIFTAWQEARDA